MPIYEYQCQSCSEVIEVIQPMGSEAPGDCECGGSLERVFSATSLNLGRYSSRSAEKHSKVSVTEQARLEEHRFKGVSKNTGIPYSDLFEVH